MGFIEDLSLKVRRGESPFYRTIRGAIKGLLRSNLPLPGFMRPVYRGLYAFPFAVRFVFQWALNYFYREPAFRSRCKRVGRNLSLYALPDITGHTEIEIGDDVNLFGHMGVGSGRVFDHPRLVIGNRVDLGHRVFFTVNKEVIIEDDVNIADNVRIVDSDAHPRDAQARALDLPPPPDEIKPVRICSKAWLGQGCSIMKGVTVGEGAIIGVNSVVVTDIPPYALALGIPARVLVKDTRVGSGSPAQPESSVAPLTPSSQAS